MVTLYDVIWDCISNFCLLLFALLLFKQNKGAWLLIIISVIIKLYIYGKYSLLVAFVYMSVQLITVLAAGIIWLLDTNFYKPSFKKIISALFVSISLIALWIILVYKFINPAILSWELLFGFNYFCYMLLVFGGILAFYRIIFGLIFIAIVFFSYAYYYAEAALVTQNAPQQFQQFILYYWLSAVFAFIAGALLLAVYSKNKK